MGLVRKLDIPFNELLQSSLELAAARDLDLILYIGYLGKAAQADFILEMIQTYRHQIKTIIVDPVCGDHGRKYVPDDVIERWPLLVKKGDYVFPNLTELKILTGNPPDAADQDVEMFVREFQNRYPDTKLIVTSVKTYADTIGVIAFSGEAFGCFNPVLTKNFGGTGDAFLAHFILNYFYKQATFNEALKLAADTTWALMKYSIEKNGDDLILIKPE